MEQNSPGAMEAENRLLNLILDSSFGNIFVTDGEGNIIYANEMVARNLGMTKEALTALSVFDLVSKHIISYKPASITVMETGEKYIQSVQVPSGENLVLSAEPLFDDAGRIQYIVVFSQNRMVIREFMNVLQRENKATRQALHHVLYDAQADGNLVAESPATRICLHMAEKAARSESTIMLYGESGTGKEVFARFIHNHSLRAHQIFLPVNCAAIPQELMESEFFGYDKGAFTGASREGKLGLFELAHGGTLFLDEIGELSPSFQSKLLRVLEAGEIKRVGSTAIQKVNVRIVAATNRDLQAMTKEGSFREDLFYRLNVIPITIPPLRERCEDTAVLATQFLHQLNKKYSARKQFSPQALAVLQNYRWPGNVRELRNVIERAFVIVPDDMITERHISDILGVGTASASGGIQPEAVLDKQFWEGSLQAATERFQRAYLARALRACRGNVREAARQVGLGRSGLYKKLDRLGMMQKSHWIDPENTP